MNIHGAKMLCEQSKRHYHDLLCGQNLEAVPEQVINHVKHCLHCQEQMDGLRQILLLSATSGKSNHTRAVAAMTDVLTLHMAYMGKSVTCQIVTPFLPGLVIPELEVTVPTPITVHLDKCRQCCETLEKIRQLNLTRGQLCRLSDFFADDSPDCSYAADDKEKIARRLAVMDWQGLDAGALKHSSKCLLCRDLVYQQRQEILENLPASEKPQDFPCEHISMAAIFDYVLPYGLNPAADQYEKLRWPFVSHVIKCPECLAKMQQMHNDLCQIDSMPDSGVVTMFHKDSRRPAESLDEANKLYAGFPIRVETVTESNDEKPVTSAVSEACTERSRSVKPSVVNFTETVEKKKATRFKLSYDTKATIAAAALIVIGISIFFYKPAVATLNPLDKIQQAMRLVSSVHAMQFVTGRNEPISEQWASKTLGILKVKDKSGLVLYDTNNRIVKTKRFDANIVQTASLGGDDLINAEKNIAKYVGLSPFIDRAIFNDSKWSRVVDDGVTTGVESYDAAFTIKDSNGYDISYKRRFFVERDTFLPEKIEFYRKFAADENYTLTSTYVFECLSDGQVESAIDGF